MAAKDLGNKFVCVKCSTKFYDLKKPDPICPKCGADQREVQPTKPAEKKSRLAAAPKIIEPVETPATDEIPEDEEIEAIPADEEDEEP